VGGRECLFYDALSRAEIVKHRTKYVGCLWIMNVKGYGRKRSCLILGLILVLA
jgi:hypothetical protein